MIRVLGSMAILIAASGCANPTAHRMVVASDLSNRPFAYVDEHDEPAGIEVELITMIAKRLGTSITWSRREFDELLPACAANDVDVVAATIGITPERELEVLFSRPYFRTRIAIVVRSGPGEPTSYDSLNGRKVCASYGTTSERAVRQELPDATLVLTGKDATTVADQFESGAIDGAAMDGPDATRLVAASGGTLRELSPLSEEHYAFAIAPSRHDLRAEFNKALNRLDRDGTLRKLLVKFKIEAR